MKVSLRNYLENYPTGMTWKIVLMMILLLQINTYLIVYYIVPCSIFKELDQATNGLITSRQIAFLYKILIYSLLFKLLRFPIPKSKKLLNNAKITFILCAAIAILFLILFLMNIDTESNKNPSVGFFIELLLGAVFEELFIRYLLLAGLIQLLKKKFGTKSIWLSIILSSLIFSLTHLFSHIQSNNVQLDFFVFAFLLGVLLSWIYIWFNNIILVIILHLIVNLYILYLPITVNGGTTMNLCWLIIVIILAVFGPKIKKAAKI